MSSVAVDHEHMDSLAEVAELLFGDGAYELVTKMSPTSPDLSTKKRERRQAQVGLASNVVGIAAGTAGTAAALKDFKTVKGAFKATATKAPGKFARAASHIKTKHAVGLAGAALGLQVANVAGDAVANRVLARSARAPQDHKKKIAKGSPDGADLRVSRGSLIAASVKAGGPPVQKIGVKVGNRIKKSDELDILWEGEFAKFDTDKRQVFGWASIVEVNGEPVVDLQGDYISADEIEKAAYEYVQKSRKGGDMHRRDGEKAFHASEMIESFMVTPEKVEKMGLPPDSLPTGWWVGYAVHDDATWDLVKSGKRSGFSIHGRGKRVSQEG